MCLIAFAIGMSERWPLVIASNRDEFFARPTAPLALWTGPRGHTIASGRDLQDGGTWLGVSTNGRVAMLTNVRQPQPTSHPRSRGILVSRWLDGDEDFASYCAALDLPGDAQSFGGFNLVVGDWQTQQWHACSNRGTDRALGWDSRRLSPGLYGLSNAALDTPWPKTLALKKSLAEALTAQEFDVLCQTLLPTLQNRQAAPLELLPHTGVGLERETALSSAFVDLPGYGTRCSAAIALSAAASGGAYIQFKEWSYADAEDAGTQQLTFACASA